MGLPIIKTPVLETTLPVSQKKVKYRPFLVKEEKLAILALTETDEDKKNQAFMRAAVNITQNCILSEDIKVIDLETADFEWLFVKLRMASKGEDVALSVPCMKCGHANPYTADLRLAKVIGGQDGRILLSEDIGIKLKYPTIDNVIENIGDENAKLNHLDMLFDSTEMIWQGEKTYTDFTKEEFEAFTEPFDAGMMNKINDFFENIPAVAVDIEFTCNHTDDQDVVCGHENKRSLKGIPRFFV